jgi:hypothetical protein
MIRDSWVIFDIPIHPNPEKFDFEPAVTKKIVTQKGVILVFFWPKYLFLPKNDENNHLKCTFSETTTYTH